MITIYYVEDDELISQTVKEFLGKQGYIVSVYPTIADAKQALNKMRPALVLVDWNMPDESGSVYASGYVLTGGSCLSFS